MIYATVEVALNIKNVMVQNDSYVVRRVCVMAFSIAVIETSTV